MTNEQINAAIAEACGWVPGCDRGICWDQHGNAIITAPDYCNDLNAMHEAEKVLTEHQNDSIYPRNLGAWRNPTKAIYAPAAQRSEAFLRTLGLWEEAQ